MLIIINFMHDCSSTYRVKKQTRGFYIGGVHSTDFGHHSILPPQIHIIITSQNSTDRKRML